jgi:ABC-type Fe3+ transport system substrate-binding protein
LFTFDADDCRLRQPRETPFHQIAALRAQTAYSAKRAAGAVDEARHRPSIRTLHASEEHMSVRLERRKLLAVGGAAIVWPSVAFAQKSPAETKSKHGDETLDGLYARARKEGVLNLYGGGPAFWYADWAAQFKAAFPEIAVNFSGGFSNQLAPRIDQQIASGRMECDVAVLQTLQDFARWKTKGELIGLPSEVFDHIDKRYYDPSGTYVGVSLYTLSYAYNATLVGESIPSTASDFVNPDYRGKVITVYPHTDDVTLFLFWTIVSKYGWGWMKDYIANKPNFIKGHLGVAQAIDQGRAAVSFDTITELSVVQPGYGQQSHVVISKVDSTPYWPQSMGIFQNCPHPAAAELFVRWSLGKEQQRVMNRKGVWTVRDDVDPPDGFRPIREYKLADGYGEFVANETHLVELRNRFQEIIGQPVGGDVR